MKTKYIYIILFLLLSVRALPGQNTMSSPVNMGSYGSSFTYTDTKNTSSYTNNYTGRSTNDIFYKFTITMAMDVVVSHCGSAVNDTYVYLLDSSGNLITSNDDYSGDGKCSSTYNSYLRMLNLAAGTYYVVSEGYSQNGNITTTIQGIVPVIGMGVGSSNQNYIHTRTYTNEAGTAYLDVIQYYDGLGRPIQTIQAGITPSKKDLVSVQTYDAFGREDETWLPGLSSGNGSYVTEATAKTNTISANLGDQKPFSKTAYEPSPLNRPTAQYGPGADWHNNSKAVTTAYKTNVAGNNTLNCKQYVAGGTNQAPTLSQNGNYATGQLYVTELKDENGNVSYVFKDKLGQVILARQINASVNHDTYYVYNDFGNLCFVLPPLVADNGTNQTERDKYAYQYKYDDRNRCIYKKLPGCEPIYYIYDKADRLIFSQDGEQRLKGEWAFTLPDAFGRIVLAGTCTNSLNYLADPLSSVVVTATRANANNTYKGYGAPANITLTNPVILSVNYYDDYAFLGYNGIPNTTDSQYTTEAGYGTSYGDHQAANKAKNKGLLTGTLTAQMNSTGGVESTYLYSVMYYDSRGRVVQVKSNNPLSGGLEKEYIAYNFTGQPTQRKHVHSATGKNTLTEVYVYTYDHAGRLTKTTHQLTEGTIVRPQVTLAENTYDELGRLKTNKKGGQTNLNTTYSYNVRSWTKSISSPLFSQTLYYNDHATTSLRQYNGNISGMAWIVDGQNRNYAFAYDELSRLKSATYTGTTNEKYGTIYAYDKHGNMTTLQRYGKKDAGTNAASYGLVDNLTMAYSGNQLSNVADAITNFAYSESADFKDKVSPAGTVEYAYNRNGAMYKDINKGIEEIQYNSLNLPQAMLIKSPAAKAKNYYTYSASGVKLRTEQRYDANLVANPVITTTPTNDELKDYKITEYAGNIIYETSKRATATTATNKTRILVDGGYIEGGVYYYYLNDHLGNNRVVANASGTVTQKNHYYPFGSAFAENTVAEQGKQPYKYNGKELDQMHGLNLYDYSARYYESAIGRFTSVDPLAEKKPWMSPYAYCSNNPINRIDPDGRDDYRLDRDGELYFVKKTNAENHTLYATTSKGKLDSKNSLQVDKYVLNNKESVSGVQGMRSDGSIETATLDIYTSFGNEKSTALFEFASNNTDVEWSHTKTTQEGVSIDYISTSHQGNSDVSQSFVIDRVFKQNDRMSMQNAITEQPGINIREANHSHPNNSRIVSHGDVNLAKTLQSKFPNATMHNYAIPSRIYTEFDMYSIPGLLPPVEIIAPALKKK